MNGNRPLYSDEPVRRILLAAFSFDIPGGMAVQASRLLARLEQEPSIKVAFLPVNPRLPGAWRRLQTVKYLRTLATTALYFMTMIAHARSCDVIHVFTASHSSFLLVSWPAIVAGKLFGKKIILNYHGGRARDHLERSPLASRRTISFADLLVVPSQYLVEIFADFGLRARAVPNFIESECFQFRERRPLRPVFLSTRHLEPHYNVACILRAFSVIQARIPSARLIIAGQGSQREELALLARTLNLHNVEFIGQQNHEEMRRLYGLADILLNSSEIDNQPLSIIEAFASGMPVIATRTGGVPYLIKDKETGLLVEKGDHLAMARAAMELLEDDELALGIARNALRESRGFNWSRVRGKWLDIYGGLMGTVECCEK
jgi:glycosyltransferase involved in cell wall biosynthesis